MQTAERIRPNEMRTNGLVHRLSHCLIVAGPSGVGKSTFIRQLADGLLPVEIANRLPANARSWPLTSSRHGPEVWSALVRDQHPEGLIAHADTYALTFPAIRLGRSAPPCEFLDFAATAQSIQMISLEASAEQIVEQCLQFAWKKRDKSHTDPFLKRSEFERILRASLFNGADEKDIAALLVRAGIRNSESVARKLDLYRQPDGLKRMNHHWNQYLETHLAGRDFIQIRMRPLNSPDTAWRIVGS